MSSRQVLADLTPHDRRIVTTVLCHLVGRSTLQEMDEVFLNVMNHRYVMWGPEMWVSPADLAIFRRLGHEYLLDNLGDS